MAVDELKQAMINHWQTRQVLAGAYRGREVGKRVLLTHLCAIDWSGSGCRVPVENMADELAEPEGNYQRPTCPVCAKKWDRLRG